MMTQPKRRLVLPSIVALAVVIGLAASIVYAFPPNPASPAYTQSFPTRQTASNGDWNFTASINSSSVPLGQSIRLLTSLTNISPTNQTIAPYVEPLINPGVYSSNGTEVWAWNPPQVNWATMTFPSGQVLSGNVVIPTSQLQAGQTYTIKVVPISIQFLTPASLALSFQFSVR